MPKDKLTDYSATNASNTDVGGVNTDEGMLPSAVNNAIREVMTHLKNFAAGTDGIDVLSLADDTATNAMKIQAPSSVTADTTLTLPDGDGSDGQALVTDGSGTLSWAGLHSAKNLIINGSCQVAQRGTSSTTIGYGTVDRFQSNYSGGTVTQSQEDLTSGLPRDAGFSNFFRMTNTTAGSNAATDYNGLYQYIEAQNVRNSGWNYTSSSSYLSLQFWARSSVAGTYYTQLVTYDGTQKNYNHSFVLAANTWTKISLTIVGDSSLQFDNDNGTGLLVAVLPYYGTDYTDSAVNTDEWFTHSASNQAPDFAQNWRSTTGATFDVTGIQLTVGDVALPFIHESYAETLAKCQRYYYWSGFPSNTSGNITTTGFSSYEGRVITSPHRADNRLAVNHPYPVTMRDYPACTVYSKQGTVNKANPYNNTTEVTISNVYGGGPNSFSGYLQSSSTLSSDTFYEFFLESDSEL